MKKILSFVLSILMLVATMAVPSFADGPTQSMRISGTFLQPWLYAYLPDSRLELEFAAMHNMGIDTVIMGDIAIKHDNDNNYTVNYPTTLTEFSNSDVTDNVSKLFELCEEYDMKLYLGLGLNSDWWNKNLSNNSDATWLNQQCSLSAKIARDLYNQYNSYGDTFGGYYWVYEIWNHQDWNGYFTRNRYADNLANGFNIVLDAIDSFDSSRPLIFSPFATNSGFSTSANLTRFYTRLFNKSHFRNYDVMAPMDNIGGGGQSLSTLETWTEAYYDAVVASGDKVKFWSNCESFNQQDGYTPATIDRYVQQMDITSQYVEKIICFSWYHYFNPYNTDPGFHNSYMYYRQNGSLENTAPSLPTSVTVTGSTTANITTSGFTDSYGISRYKLSKVVGNSKTLIAQNCIGLYYYSYENEILSKDFSNVALTSGQTNYFMLEAMDCTGNVSKIYIPVNGSNASDRRGFSTGDKGYYTEAEYNQLVS